MTVLQGIWTAERAVSDRTEFSEAVAKGLYKFTAYKDEYEVARLLTDPQFVDHVRTEIPAGQNLTYKLHPPMLRALGRRKKIGLGPRSHVALRVLAKGKRLRGTRFDPFGYWRMACAATRTSNSPVWRSIASDFASTAWDDDLVNMLPSRPPPFKM